MSSENPNHPRSKASKPDFDFSSPALIPPVHVLKPDSEDDDLNRWANERIAIYASLDAAMTRHIVDAISALSELKRSVEEEAFQASQKIIMERDRLAQEVAQLRLEHVRLEDQIKESRRAYDEEKIRRTVLEQSTAAFTEQAQAERDELQHQVRRLKIQLDEARAELHKLYQNQLDLIETGEFPGWLGNSAPDTSGPTTPAQQAAQVFSRPPELKPADFTGLARPLVEFEPSIPQYEAEDVFGDSPTPRIPGGSPVLTRPPASAPPEPAPDGPPAKITTLDEIFMAGEAADETEKAEDIQAFKALSQIPTPMPVPDITPAGPARLSNVKEPATGSRVHRDRVRRARTEQRIQQILGKRRLRVPEIAPSADSGEIPGYKEPAPKFKPSPTGRSFQSTSNRLEALEQQSPEVAAASKESLKELGAQLGLDPMTPPPLSSMRFAHGFTPPRPVARRLLDLQVKTPAPAAPEAAASPAVLPAPAARKEAPPVETASQAQPPASPRPSTSGSLLHFYEPEPAELSEDMEAGSLTLEELLAAGEEEIAAINENPTPPEDPAPLIGKLGPDNAVSFRAEEILPGKQPAIPQIFELDFPPPPDNSSEKTWHPSPPEPGPARRLAAGPLLFPGHQFSPPPDSSGSAGDTGATTLTKLTVSNLQGRFSPLVMEKMVRGLEGVAHVIVTDFSQGVLVMDVRHAASLDLGQKLLSLPDMHLRLVEQSGNTLEFEQEVTSAGS